MVGSAVGLGVTLLQVGTLCIPPLFGFIVDASGSFEKAWIALSILVLLGVVTEAFVKEKQAARQVGEGIQ